MIVEKLISVLSEARQSHGEGLAHLLVSWLKCARILISDGHGISPEVLAKIQSRAFLRMDIEQFDEISLQLGKDDLIVLPAAGVMNPSWSAKVVGFEDNQKLDGHFIKPLDVSVLPYFDRALAAFPGNFYDSLTPTPYLFLDRDGVIIDYVPYIQEASQVKLREGIAEVISYFRAKSYRVVMVTNQSGIGRGYSTQEDFRKVQTRTLELLAEKGQWLDANYFATAISKGTNPQAYSFPSLRKPRTGMIAEEAQFWNIDLVNSVMIGDNPSDIEWAQNGKVGNIFWLENPEMNEKSVGSLTGVHAIKKLSEVLSLLKI